MNDTRIDELLSIVAGPFTSWAISYVKGQSWSKEKRFIVAVLFSVVVGALNAYITNAIALKATMTPDDWIVNMLIVIVSAQSSYKLFIEDSAMERNLQQRGPFT